MNAGRDPEFTEYVGARLPWLRRIAFLLCQDWSRADDLVQAAITSLYVHWGRARAVEHTDSYARTILVRVYLGEQRSGWVRRVSLSGRLPERPSQAADHDAAIDLRDALALVPPRQRATVITSTGDRFGPFGPVTGREPAVNGHLAFSQSGSLVWEYAPDSWAMLSGNHVRPGARVMIKIAEGVRYGVGTRPSIEFRPS